ncbi:MAG: hypothetical protein BGO78_02250 [Chloroflexi bacterium 44-23]|nr:MAG: hypothetical protein BGO78_02250 [Chloroflexi bacterium 44-23]
MATFKQDQMMEIGGTETQWRSICTIGGVFTILALIGILLDVVIGSITGGNLSTLPPTAIARFAQFQKFPLLGLYNLDLLNLINQLLLIPTYFALYAAHRKTGNAFAQLALIIFLVGTSIFITTNTALPMLELSNKYAGATSEAQKILLASAGEAMLARGAHGSLGVFIGFLIPNIAGLTMSLAMLSGKVFNKITSYLGIMGSAFLMLYIVLVTFAPMIKDMATAFAMPGGLLSIAWMILYAIRLFQLGQSVHEKKSDLT